MNAEKLQVFVVSQQPLLWQGIEHSISLMEDIEVSATAEVNDEVLLTLDRLPPDVVIVDIDALTDGSSLSMTRQLKQRLPNIGIIALTSNLNNVQIFRALKAQAAACLSKETTVEKLVQTIRQVAHGEYPINESLVTHPILADQVLRQFQELSRQSEAQSFISPLTQRETEILDYIAQGLLNKQIALKLGISEQTIKNHVTSILRKLNANARTEAVVLALKQGLISIK
jgi:two-component system, NarL family, response regulator DegU